MAYKLILVVIIFLIPLSFFVSWHREKMQIEEEPASSSQSGSSDEGITINSLYIDVSPDVKPSTREGWLIFMHPSKGYSFEYPSDWNVKVLKNRYVKDDIYEVTLSYFESGKHYSINFMTGGRGGPNFDYETTENKNFGTTSVIWNKMYRDSQLFEAVVSFPDNEFEEYFVGLYIYFPPTNQEKFEQIIDDIVASLKKA